MVYVDKPTTLEALEVNINWAINEIRPEILENVVKNWTDRIRFVTISRGGHMPEIIFKGSSSTNIRPQEKIDNFAFKNSNIINEGLIWERKDYFPWK